MEKESKKTFLKTSRRTKKILFFHRYHLGQLGIEACERGNRLQHIKWMCSYAEINIDDDVRANRWLGFVHAWLVVVDMLSLDDVIMSDEVTGEMEKESKKTFLETSRKTKRLLSFYRRHLGQLGIEAIDRGDRLQHAKWMCDYAEININDDSRANLWLGFVQGWLVTEDIYNLDDVMEHSRNGV